MSGEAAAAAFPTAVVFNYIKPMPIVQAHLIINCVVVALALIALGLRTWARFVTRAKIGWDDWLAYAAMPQGIGMLVIQGLYSRLGVGYDVTITILNMPLILRLLVAYEFIYAICIFTVKMSMLCFYLRVFVNKNLRRATLASMVFVVTWNVANILQVFLICRPFKATYDLSVVGTCGDRIGSFIAIGSFNIITDILILSLPMSTIWSLKMKKAAKAGITIVFCMGLLVSVIAIVRIVSLTQLDLNNLTGTMIYADLWSTFEPNLGIICVSLPMLGPIWTGCAGRLKSTNQASGPTGGSFPPLSQGSKQFNRLQDHNDSYGMDTIYADNAGKAPGSVKEEERSLSGSETALQPEHPPGTAITINRA